ncbi:DUF1801 domain-containing protein [Corallibacter vietnamensis]
MVNTNFYFSKEEPYKSCLLAMRDTLLNYNTHITETTKYGMPCFCYKGKAFCYIWTDKKTKNPYYLMVEGKRLLNLHLEPGDRAKMKILPIQPDKDLPIKIINAVMDEAISLYENGTIKIK